MRPGAPVVAQLPVEGELPKDKDGYVTKEEFLKFQEKVFDSWDKNKAGRVGQAMFTDQG